MRRKTIESKIKNEYGTGNGKEYKPWIEVGEFSSQGTVSCVVNWKDGRLVHLLSQGEMLAYYTLNFEQDVIDVKEQFRLDEELTLKISKELNIIHPTKNGALYPITTDLLVRRNNNSMTAYSVKYNDKLNKRAKEKLLIEQKYWQLKGIDWQLLTKDMFNPQYVANIREVVLYYNYFNNDDSEILKHMISHHYINIDLTKEINYKELTKVKRKEIEEWKKINYKLVESSAMKMQITEY